MKIRTGFVSNSSSSSFVIGKSYLTTDQIDKIKNHNDIKSPAFQILYNEYVKMGRLKIFIKRFGKKDGTEKFNEFINCVYKSNGWNITEEPDLIAGCTVMDNFDMRGFLEELGVDLSHVRWGN